LSDVVASIARWYDIDIQFTDQTALDLPVSVTFDSESTREVLDALALITHSRYQQSGRVAVFSALR